MQYPFQMEKGHPFLKLNDQLWLIDTGSSLSFGDTRSITLSEQTFTITRAIQQVDLDAAALSKFTGVACTGLLGADILGRFDIVFDAQRGTIDFLTDEVTLPGKNNPLRFSYHAPCVETEVNGKRISMVWDTGAQLSYLEASMSKGVQTTGTADDFFPGLGKFTVQTYQTDLSISDVVLHLQCGTLPNELAYLLTATNTQGILGNQVLMNRKVGYFPRRSLLVLGD